MSLLVIPRLPFARPDALKEKERETFPNLYSFIRAIVVPEMQIKLKQGFGRAFRTETDICVVAILDEREDFNRMLSDCRKGRIDKILVKSISRFARNTKDCLASLRELTSLGMSVDFAKRKSAPKRSPPN